MNVWMVFLTGLTTGGLTCFAVQGGLLTSLVANQKEAEAGEKGQKPNSKFDSLDWMPVAMFLGAKLVAHLILGLFLGAAGSVLELNLGTRLAFQTFAGLFMVASAMNLLQVHPIFRYLAFQPPKFLQRMVRNSTKSQVLFAPAILGVLTIFIPCGVTQAMEVLAVNSGDPGQGALIMGAFVLGTMPLFATIGLAASRLAETAHVAFTRITATILILMAVYSLNGVLVVLNSPLTLQKISRPVTYFFSEERFSTSGGDTGVTSKPNGAQAVTINIRNEGYSPRYVSVKAGIPVELTLKSQETYSCALAFVLKEFGIKTFLDATDTQTFTFTPTKPGRYTYTCSMGMYTGTLEVL